jgi:membrane associated rhomboid family serine protease
LSVVPFRTRDKAAEPNSWRTARLTAAIALVTFGAWAIAALLGLGEWAAIWGGFIPARLAYGQDAMLAPFWLTPLTATLVHGGFIHIFFNLVILAFCGRPVESALGPIALAVLYLLGAYAAAGAQYLVDPLSAAPMIGASGAISAVIGAYAMLFGRNKVRIANRTLALIVNALWLMAAWIVLQLIVGITFATGMLTGEAVQIAVAAHIGGFLVGVVLATPMLRFRYRKA